jgi:thiol-disulfide isomerase/thioredoxin
MQPGSEPRGHVQGLLVLCVAGLSVLGACQDRRETPPARPAPSATHTQQRERPRFIPAPRTLNAVEPFVQEHVEAADRTGGRVLVYVGASWCEPCQRFHKAVENGELDALLTGTRFVEFDADQHGTQLRNAGYNYRLIPVFAVPDAAGRATGRLLTGSVKGPSAVKDNLAPRLAALLAGRPVE